ncbi:MAG: hypothetical protein QG650_342 [Patescibacteria group bacterium]|nr:hypothetical protein [Patescibacteria group bacterium]
MTHPHANSGAPTCIPVAFGKIPEISVFLNSVRTCDDRTLKMRLAELEAEEMTGADWNAFGIAARAVLVNHPAYGPVLEIIQRKGGI